ncbi:ABC transporter permease [Paenarthrobacter sp. NPDC057981]|uniref:ABC transporter permease n=1 Tax=Paenarthrobacter sp. NPDC057981 TaxID=3346297 RepID=UPI0036DD7E6B
MLLSAVIGVAVASAAALAPRWLDEAVMRVTDIFMAIPGLVMALGITAVLGPSLWSIVIAMTVVTWPATTRITRNVLRETMTSTYMEAGHVMGISKPRLMLRHALPNSLDAVYVFASMEFSGAIIMMSGLAFLGVGAPPPSADWGSMVAAGQESITTGWWVALFPGLAITVSAAAFSLLGDGLRRINDPSFRATL